LVLLALAVSACGGGNVAGDGGLRSIVVAEDDRTLELEFDVCDADPFDVRVDEETATEVVLHVRVGGGSDDACADGAVLHLDQPLGDRHVLVNGDREIDVAGRTQPGPPPTTNLSDLLSPGR
jgi:hypothetical protein